MDILVVDDDEITLALLENVLGEAGHTVCMARSAEEALALIRAGTYRMVITDWMMPGLSGLDLCRHIRHASQVGYVYIMILTSRATTEDVVAGLSAGADDFITKPFDAAELQVRAKVAERVLGLETRDVTIFALAKLAESRDPETGAHLERIRSYCRLLAQQLQTAGVAEVDDEFIQLIYQTSPLHDIGKVGIPDCVLLKPGRLDEDEFDMMKRHTLIGAETLEAAAEEFPSAKFLIMARDIARSHHERYDGRGYPDRLARDDIPLCARIVALADVYDALTSRRVYKDAYSHEVARSTIIEGRGTHFDPAVVAAFEAVEEDFRSLQHALADVDGATAGI